MLRIRTGARHGLRWGMFGFVAAVLFTISSGPSHAAPYADIVVDANSGTVLHSTNPDAQRHPASLTKIMTLYLLFEQLEAGKLKLDSQLQVSKEAAGQMPTKLGLKPGSTLAVEDAIKGMVTRSANDAAVVVAEAIAGDEDAFARLMTRKAQALGMSRTVYKNASGLPDSRSGDHGARSIDARTRRAGTLPALLQIFLDPHVHLPRPVHRQPQSSAGPRRRCRRHQDRLCQRLRVQPGDVGSPRQSLPRRGGDGRQQRRQPRRENARSDQRQDRPGLGQAHRADGCRRVCAAGGEARTKAVAKVEAIRAEGAAKAEPNRSRRWRPRSTQTGAEGRGQGRSKSEARFAVASAVSLPVRFDSAPRAGRTGDAKRSAAGGRATASLAGSTDPIRPVLVKTLSVKAGTQTASLAPLQCPAAAGGRAPTVRAAAPVAPPAPPAPVVAVKPEPPAPQPAPVVAAKPEPAPSAPPVAAKIEAAAPGAGDCEQAGGAGLILCRRASAGAARRPLPVPSPRAAASAAAPARVAAAAVAAARRARARGQAAAPQRLDDPGRRLSGRTGGQAAPHRRPEQGRQAAHPRRAFTETVVKGGTTYYRARFAGLDKDSGGSRLQVSQA